MVDSVLPLFIAGKTMENIRKRIRIVLVNKKRSHAWQTSKPAFKRFSIFSENLAGVELMQTSLTMDKPIYVGFSVLELSKLLMFQFHYDTMKPKFPNSKLCFTDTDSFLYHITTPNVYQEIGKMNEHFDFSNYPQSSPLYDSSNHAVVGRFKDECGGVLIKEFVGLRAKCYSILLDDDEQKSAAAGVKTSVAKKHLNHALYRQTIAGDIMGEDFYVTQKSFRSYNHTLKTVSVRRVGLTRYCDKRWVCDDGITTRPHGHYLNVL